jgi:hypothetical protein
VVDSLDSIRWPAGRPATPASAFFWRDTVSETARALQAEANARAASAKTAQAAAARGVNRSTIRGLSRKSDAQQQSRNRAAAGGASA